LDNVFKLDLFATSSQ